jgi:hypothetical protein
MQKERERERGEDHSLRVKGKSQIKKSFNSFYFKKESFTHGQEARLWAREGKCRLLQEIANFLIFLLGSRFLLEIYIIKMYKF